MTQASRVRIQPDGEVDPSARIGEGTVVWQLAQIREDAEVGASCVISRGAYIDAGVIVGEHSKIQNYALVYAPARLDEGVFVGPAAVLTNDSYPRAIEADGRLKGGQDWEPRGVTVGKGASIGAQAVVLGGVSLGRWSMVAAGAVVTRDVPDHGLVMGTPARRIGWVGPDGTPLVAHGEGFWYGPSSGVWYLEADGTLVERP
jgi:acetyltransferase-like isoleucine patch superfamily enzyme